MASIAGILALGVSACAELPNQPAPVGVEASASAQPDAGLVVSNLSVASGRAYQIAANGLDNGERIYIDRDYTFEELPAVGLGLTYIRTASNDQGVLGNPNFLRFDINLPATVIVAYHAAAPPPDWVRTQFVETGETLVVRRNQQLIRYELWARGFAAGPVVLGSNRDEPNNAAMYSVIVSPMLVELPPLPPPAPPPPPPPPPGGPPSFQEVVDGIRPRGFAQGPYVLRQPAAGRTMYWVATNGSDNNPGTSAQPFRTIHRAAQVAGAGDVVTIRNGTYNETVRVRNGGTQSQRLVFQAENRGGVVLSGGNHNFAPQGWTASVMQTGPTWVTIRGLVFREYSRAHASTTPPWRPAVGAIRGWRIEDCLFDRAGYDAILIRGDDVSVVKTTIQYTHTHAITAGTGQSPSNWNGQQLRNIEVVDVVLRRNNTRPDPLQHPVSTRVVKFMMTDNVLIENIRSYENYGPGWWFDRYNSNYTIRHSFFHNNRNDASGSNNGRGIYLEVNHGPGVVFNNVIADNVREAISVANSEHVRIERNLIANNDRCVILSATDRGGPDRLRDVDIRDNYCKGWRGASAIHPVGPLHSHPSAMNIRGDGNTYDPGAVNRLTWWPDVGFITTIAQMRSLIGWEQNGQIGPVQWPLQ